MIGETNPVQNGADRLHDEKRLKAIAELDLNKLRADEVLRAIVDEAAEKLNLPVSLITLVLDQSQIFPVSTGLSGWLAKVQGSPVEWSFCANAVRSEAPFVVEDAREHPVVKDNPLVNNDGIRCYAGIPLRARNGRVVGTLCVIGSEERVFDESDMQILCELANRATRRMHELAKAA